MSSFNIAILKSSKIQDPKSNRRLIQEAHLAATKEEWGYTIVKDRSGFKEGEFMTFREFWVYVAGLGQVVW